MNTAFRRHDPLTQRTARTLREINDNPRDWWEASERDADSLHAEEQTGYSGKWWTAVALLAAIGGYLIVTGAPA